MALRSNEINALHINCKSHLCSVRLDERQLWPLLDADADRADLELRLIKLLLKDRARVHPFAGNGGSSAKPAVAESGGFESHKSDLQLVCNALISLGRNTIT